MRPVIGSPSEIIQQALTLGLLCRPVLGHGTEIGFGEALEVGRDSFWHWSPDPAWPVRDYRVSPYELTLDWELTTKDLLRNELRKTQEEPW